jgi:hypothetical protein
MFIAKCCQLLAKPVWPNQAKPMADGEKIRPLIKYYHIFLCNTVTYHKGGRKFYFFKSMHLKSHWYWTMYSMYYKDSTSSLLQRPYYIGPTCHRVLLLSTVRTLNAWWSLCTKHAATVSLMAHTVHKLIVLYTDFYVPKGIIAQNLMVFKEFGNKMICSY